ncbi:protein decapping 5 isoform X2 [Physcomitrium patens]|uniref:DFDF domain-containing protein n=1 Tax=Physcomitrium patens TaxID=3218 RepID=A0A2K1K5Y3_PHYPA|nr:protein decapping 5-like isoform X2 [Physcomitrium patens]PNR49191.1 hypothetical protein PHYPA_011087 [Physcomitrium patens]|eukprot:XP_024383387.1 protein decapping 5-like isoform X2 [Physcomitrella patens]
MGRGRGPNTADSYIGSLISLTSKSEIRYEGILYTVDTENSNIALQNVRSFGTEGRKKEGPQIPASDKVYDYIIFRGSDIKDLQVKSSPPPPLHPPPLHQPTDPAIISLQVPHSQLQYPLPSSLGPYNGGIPAAGSSSEPSAPPPYMGMPPSPYRSAVPPLYPPAGLQSWGPPPPLPGANGSGLAMPMYWHGYYRPPPAGHMQHQPMPPQPPPPLAVPSQGQPLQQQQLQQQQQPQPIQQSQQGPQPPPLAQQVAPSSRPQGPINGPSSSGVATPALQSHTQPSTSSDSKAPVSSTAITLTPLVAATTAPASTAVKPTESAMSTVAAPVASSIGTTVSASASGVPISAASSLPFSMQGVSAMITPVAKNPRRIVGSVSQVPSQQAVGSFSQGLSTQSTSSAPTLSSEYLITPQIETAQSSESVASAAKPGPTIAQSQVAPKLEQKTAELAHVAITPVVQTSSQTATSQAQVSQPLLPLPTGEQKQQATAQRGSHSAPVGQKNRWQGNGYQGNGNYNRRGRGRGSGSGRGLGLANPTHQFTEDFDFTAMNEKFKKDEVWGTLGGKDEEEEYEDDDGNVEADAADSAQSDASKKALYNKDDFFDSLSCDATHGGRGERPKFSEQRRIDTETFGAFPVRSSGGRGGRRGGHRGGYFGGGGGSYGIGRAGGYGRGRASSGNV